MHASPFPVKTDSSHALKLQALEHDVSVGYKITHLF